MKIIAHNISNRPWSLRLRLMRLAQLFAIALALTLVVGACARAGSPQEEGSGKENPAGNAASASPPSTGSPKDDTGPDAEIRKVSRRQWDAMLKAGMVRPECPIQRPTELRLVEVNHFDFNGEVKRGRLVVNADVAESVARIFGELYEERFPIRRMEPVEAFDGDTNASLDADNTSAFNCRRADQINAPFAASPHANGRAVDINPRENPWRDLRCKCWFPSPKNRLRDTGPGKITKGGLVWRAFRAEGWIWQNIDVPDYMHFDTGYPSRPFDPDQRR